MRILVLSAHADDAQLAAGGTILRVIEDGGEVFYVGLSIAEESVPDTFPPESLDAEARAACLELKMPTRNVEIMRYRVRYFPEKRQSILEDFIRMRRDLGPDLVFIPSTSDIHQDHAVVAAEALRAFRRTSSLYGYDFPWNVLQTSPLQLFVELSEIHLAHKVRACQCFKSQLEKENNCFTEDYIRSLAVERGNRIGSRYAEAFEVLRDVRRVGRGVLE